MLFTLTFLQPERRTHLTPWSWFTFKFRGSQEVWLLVKAKVVGEITHLRILYTVPVPPALLPNEILKTSFDAITVVGKRDNVIEALSFSLASLT